MRRFAVPFAIAVALATAGALAEAPESPLVVPAEPDPGEARVLAEGEGGALTQGGVDAYIESLEFILAQMGQATEFENEQRDAIGTSLARRYSEYPVEIQEDLANLPTIWSHYLQTWPMIGPAAKRDFAFTVLALAFGAEEAAAAVGIELGGDPAATPHAE